MSFIPLLFLLALPFLVVFLALATALYWPTRFSLRGMLIGVTWLVIALGLAAAFYRWPK
jgi:hypothetical protein